MVEGVNITHWFVLVPQFFHLRYARTSGDTSELAVVPDFNLRSPKDHVDAVLKRLIL